MFLFGIILSIFSPLFGIIWGLLYYMWKRQPLLSAIVIGFSFAFAFLGYIPDINADINRHMSWIEYYRHIPFSKCFDAGHYKMTYIWDAWNWVIAHFSDSNFLKASGAFVGYTISSYLLFDLGKRLSIGNRNIIVLFLTMICIIPGHQVVCGVRNCNAFLFCCLAFYIYVCGGNNKLILSIILLIVATLIHHSSLVIFVVFFIYMLCMNKNQIRYSIIVFVATVGVGVLSNFLLSILPSSGSTILNLFRDSLLEAVGHTNDTRLWYVTQASSLNTRVNNIWAFVLISLFIIRSYLLHTHDLLTFKNSKSLEKSFESRFRNATMLLFSTCLGLSISFTYNGQRYIAPCLVLGMLMFACRIEKYPLTSVRSWKNQFVDVCIVIGLFGIFLLHMYSLVYGTASIMSLLEGCFIGALSL